LEGFGLPGLEAMGYGAPVVSSNATCLPEVYDDAAHYFDPLNTDDMARAIDDVLSNKSLRNKLIAEGYKQIAKYSWGRMAKQTYSVYIDAIRNYIRP
jgi:glycosyltransferase involved in cell wall biosynthesis